MVVLENGVITEEGRYDVLVSHETADMFHVDVAHCLFPPFHLETEITLLIRVVVVSSSRQSIPDVDGCSTASEISYRP